MSVLINGIKYQLIKELGKGGNGKVYIAISENENEIYAIKTISIDELSDEEIELIENEAKILSSIDDEHIVKYYGSTKDSNTFYILMEFCGGSDLKKFINEFKKNNEFIEEYIIYRIVLDLCLGIKKIHDNNLIHRDLKPENLFITEDYKIKIGYFGISKQMDSNNQYANTYVGTNNYMAPEVIKGEKYNNKVDIWALGCIIYELLTLNVCFESKCLFGFVDKILNKSHGKIDINKYNSKWQNIIDLLLKKDYKERPNIGDVFQSIIDMEKKFCIKMINKNELADLENKGKVLFRANSKIIFNLLFD